ncbi:hypothetical protein E3E32_06025 [Thermococcus sp. GR6]|nr:hypothetical protein [Thermococcus sp. GR6]
MDCSRYVHSLDTLPTGLAVYYVQWLYWFIHDPFSRPGGSDYLGPENWGHIRKAAFKLALPLLAVIWVLPRLTSSPERSSAFS